jgi:hypothetical protein
MSIRRARILAASVTLGLAAATALPGDTAARGGHFGGAHVGVFLGPPAPYCGPRYWGPPYWGPPPVYYAPPPAYYAPPPVVYMPPPVVYPPGTPYIPGYVPITPPGTPPGTPQSGQQRR